jgi:hypothetical protein
MKFLFKFLIRPTGKLEMMKRNREDIGTEGSSPGVTVQVDLRKISFS